MISAQGKCAPPLDADKAAKAPKASKDGTGPGPAAAHTAVLSLGWSADASQLATAERGGVGPAGQRPDNAQRMPRHSPHVRPSFLASNGIT